MFNGGNRNTRDAEVSSTRRLGVLLRPYSWRMAGAVVMLIALAMVNMLIPAFIAVLLNDVFEPPHQWSILWLILAGILGVYLARNALYFGSKYTSVRVGESVCFELRNHLFQHLQQMKLRFYRHNKPGHISSRVMNDSYVIESFIQEELPTLLQATFRFLCLIAIIYAVNWQLALASTIVLPFHLIAFYWFRRPIKAASRVTQEQLAIAQGNLIERFSGMDVVKGFSGEKREGEAFTEAIDRSRRSDRKTKTYHVVQKIVADLLVGVGTIGLLWFGAYQVMKPEHLNPMSVGTFVAFFGYVTMLYPTVVELTSGFAKLARSSASIDRVFDVLENDDAETIPARPPARPAIKGRIEFDSVWFNSDEGAPILIDINLKVEPGQVCAIIGPSGAGKTTLTSLVPRFVDADNGRILIDDIDTQDIDLPHLRESIGVAFQECFLFNASILENLRYARPDATMNEIITVAKRTCAHEFILKLPHGYDTVIGEEGVSLSRGEKQRITLTRAMLKNPKILILDEATASLDAASEAAIIPEILDFMQGKTTMMITHRPALLKHADLVVKLEDGQVTYQGKPEGLKPQWIDAPSPAPKRRTVIQHAKQLLLTLTFGLALFMPATSGGADEVVGGNTTGKFIAHPGVSEVEIEDIFDVTITQMQATLGYSVATADEVSQLPDPLGAFDRIMTLTRKHGDNHRFVQIGYRVFRSQPIHVWVYGINKRDGQTVANDDVADIENLLANARISMNAHAQNLKVGDLEAKVIKLSYVEPDRCMAMLKTLGYETVEYKKAGEAVGKQSIIEPSKSVDPKKLPIIVSMPSTDAANLVGGAKATGGSFGLTMTPSIASDLPNHTNAAPLMRLMVLYNPANPNQFAALSDRIRESIDVPARQILIEAMVLEISELGLEQLGVEWEMQTPHGNLKSLTLGRLPTFNPAKDESRTLEITVGDVFGEFTTKIEALVRSGNAEILSRPSVLTLDNRQASIRVGEEIPVQTAATGARGGDKLTFDFKYIPIGILLNVRPRIASDGEEVSMQIDGIVSAQVPGQDLIVRDTGGQELVRAPRISTRRVQTYSRIQNNTPFIIGGLVSKDRSEFEDKVPILGDLPLIKHAFRRTRVDSMKREVIIVLTPYALSDEQVAGRNMPKDEDAFDSDGNKLFRDAYRIRTEDVFDLAFLKRDAHLAELRKAVDTIAERRPVMARLNPFRAFADGRTPGEHILVYRQMYEVIKRRGIDKNVDPGSLIFFERDEKSPSGFKVVFLTRKLIEIAQESSRSKRIKSVDHALRALDGKAIAITYSVTNDQGAKGLLSQPIPEFRLVDCASDSDYDQLLWQLNQPNESKDQRRTILIRSADDLSRIQRAVVLKRTVQLNANERDLTLANFTVGRLLLMPTMKRDKVNLLDAETAKAFFYSDQYYAAMRKELKATAEQVEMELNKPAVKHLLVPLDR